MAERCDSAVLDPATHYRILKLLEQNPAASQRELARAAGVSLGKLNYCLKALIAKGLVKAENFRRNPNKLGYLYVLTPQGIAERARLTVEFLRIKEREVEELRAEIEAMRQKVGAEATSSGGGPAVGGGVAFASGAGTALQFKGSYES
ncbi:MAG: MarR family EPS-associated transcriptional regulator [Rhodocyclaceae bacterium]|jgi:EPS-associated MarR family transcriptional regulator|nr:MarR family EPS-associated transcriptional regulator [Rhodocyclaceae bacterium]